MSSDKPETELVYVWTPTDEGRWVAYTSWDDLEGEVNAWAEDDIEGPIGTISVERKPVGYVASLPEFEGW